MQYDQSLTYDEAAECEDTIPASRARCEVARHGSSWGEFLDDLGEHAEYRVCDVLRWLGY